jgi:hypothetical protein
MSATVQVTHPIEFSSATGTSHFGRDPRYADLVVHIEPGGGKASQVSPASLTVWHRRFTQALTIPSSLASFLASDLGLATSSDPPAEIALWLTAHGNSLTELVDIDGLTVVPGSQPSWFTALALDE